MHRAYHYLPYRRYINESTEGRLVLHSRIIPLAIANALGLELPSSEYRFCMLDTPEPDAWIRSGSLANLKRKYQNNYALLSFPVWDLDDSIVLDTSEVVEVFKKLMDQLGKNVRPEQVVTFIQAHRDEFTLMYQRYLSGAIPLRNYRDQYEFSELAVPRVIPFSEIRLETICLNGTEVDKKFIEIFG